MAFVAVAAFLLVRFLLALAAFHRAEGEALPGGFVEEFKRAIRQLACIPQRLTLIGNQNSITNLQIYHRV